MQDVKGIDKTMTVGEGKSAYKGVSDKEVKKIIGESMQKHGLVMLPIETTPKIQIDRWEETSQYGIKQKQSVFTEVTTKYLLLHESGESQIISGYGQGVDSQDKGAGKATTYALKNTLLYTFLVPTGSIDDTDTTHSDAHETPKQTVKEQWLNPGTPEWKNSIDFLVNQNGTIDRLKKRYKLSKENEKLLIDQSSLAV